MKKLLCFILSAVFILLFSSCGAEKDSIKIVSVTDIHFAGNEYYKYKGLYKETNENNGSGKQMQYLDDITDAFIAEMLLEKPDYIIVSGDNTFNGSKESHLAFADKFSALTEAGITVLAIPGNHDIKEPSYIFPDGEYQLTSSVTPEEFAEIYSPFGYTGGISYDENSLSYVYDSGKGVRFFMLDTNMIYGATFGNLSTKTIEWLEKELIACKEAGDIPFISGHHNLLVHNEMFTFGYTVKNNEDLAELLIEYGADIYLSGHIHPQHIAEENGITDIAGGSFAVYPHRYGVIDFSKDGWTYESRGTDVEIYAQNIQSTNPDLLNYSEFGYNFFYYNAYEQAYGALSSVIEDPSLLEKYSDFSAQLNVAYFGGTFSDVDLSIAEEFLEASSKTRWGVYMKHVLDDTADSIFCTNKTEN